MAMVQLGETELKAMVTNLEKPMMIRILAKSMLSGKGFDVLERMLDRGI